MKNLILSIFGISLLLLNSCVKERVGCKDPKALNYNFVKNVKNDPKLCKYDVVVDSTFIVESCYYNEIKSDVVWKKTNSSIDYIITCEVLIKKNYSLTIEKGVNVYFENKGAIIVEKGGKLIVSGTSDLPVQMKPVDSVSRWDGVVVHGEADLSYLTISRASARDNNGNTVWPSLWIDDGDGVIKLDNVHVIDGFGKFGVGVTRFSGHTFDVTALKIENCNKSLYSESVEIINSLKNIELVNNNENVFELNGTNYSGVMKNPSYSKYIDVSDFVFESDYPIYYNSSVSLSNINVQPETQFYVRVNKSLGLHGNINFAGSPNKLIKIRPYPFGGTNNSFKGIYISYDNYGDGTAYTTLINYVDIGEVDNVCVAVGGNYDRGNMVITNSILAGIPGESTKGIAYTYYATQLDTTNTQFIDCAVNIGF